MANPFRREPNPNQPDPVPYNSIRPMTAAATRIKLNDKTEADLFRIKQGSQMVAIQNAAWEYYDAISEIKYAFNLVASVVSRIRLYVAVIENPAEQPVPLDQSEKVDPDLADAARRRLERMDSAFGGQAGLLRDAALNLSVAGECYLVQIPERPGQKLPETWDIRSVDELKIDKQGNYAVYPRRDIKPGSGSGNLPKGAIPLPAGSFMGRIWRPHPRFSEDPDTSMIGLLALCEELLLLDRTFRGSHRSRLNAGIFYVPDGLSTAAQADPDLFADEDEEQPTPEDTADAFQEELLLAMSTPIEDESSAAGVVPLLIRGPVELGKELKHITFSRPFDDSMVARSKDVLDRILQGLDVPKDSITGLANVKYSNAIQIDESMYKAHIEPMLLLLADAFTSVYLRPALIEDGWSQEEVAKLTVWYDASAVATRNDRAQDANDGYDKGVISGQAWRRAHGFADQDAPTGKEVVLRMLVEKGGLDPQLTEALLRVLAPDVIDAARGANQAQSAAPIPGDAMDILNGGTGAAPVPGAEAVPDLAQPDAGPPQDPMQPTVGDIMPAPEEPVAPGDDAPPFPLAEPGQ